MFSQGTIYRSQCTCKLPVSRRGPLCLRIIVRLAGTIDKSSCQPGPLTSPNSPAADGIVEIISAPTSNSEQIPAEYIVAANRPWSNVMFHLIAHPFARRLHASLLPLCTRPRSPAAPVACYRGLIQDMWWALTKCDSSGIEVFLLISE